MKKIIILTFLLLFTLTASSFPAYSETETKLEELENKQERIEQIRATVNSFFALAEKSDQKEMIEIALREVLEKVDAIEEEIESRIQERELYLSEENNLQITSLDIVSEYDNARIEWTTSKPSDSKLFFWNNNSSGKEMLASQTGLSLTHYVVIDELIPSVNEIITEYNFEVEAIGSDGEDYSKKEGFFNAKPYRISGMDLWRTKNHQSNCKIIDFKPTTEHKIEACQAYRELKDIEDPPFPSPEIKINSSSSTIDYGGSFNLSWDIRYATECNLSGPGIETSKVDFSGQKHIRERTVSSTYSIDCIGDGGDASKKRTVRVDPDTVPETTFPFFIH